MKKVKSLEYSAKVIVVYHSSTQVQKARLKGSRGVEVTSKSLGYYRSLNYVEDSRQRY